MEGSAHLSPVFYTYDGEDGARRENIPLSTLVRFQIHYGDEAITTVKAFQSTAVPFDP